MSFDIYVYEKTGQSPSDKSIEFSGEAINDAGYTLVYKFALDRVRGVDYKERLRIHIYNDNGVYNGEIYCSPLNIEADLYQLKEYGTGLKRAHISKLFMLIDNTYREIPVVNDTSKKVDADRDVLGLLKIICEYIKSKKIKAEKIDTEMLYNIPVLEFRNIFKNTEFRNCAYLDIKKSLKNNEYSTCANGRTDNTVKTDSVNIKVISIRAEEPDVLDCMEG